MVYWYLDPCKLPLWYCVRGLHLARGKEDEASRKNRTVPKERSSHGRETTRIKSRITITHTWARHSSPTLPTHRRSNHSGRYEQKRETRCRQHGGRVYDCTSARRYSMTVRDDPAPPLSHCYVISSGTVYTGLLVLYISSGDGVTTLNITREQGIGYTINIGFFGRDFGLP